MDSVTIKNMATDVLYLYPSFHSLTYISNPSSQEVTFKVCAPSQPLSVEGEGVGNIAILLSWTPSKFSNGEIISHVIYFREVCPWSETSFKDVLSYSSSPEYLLSNLNAGSTYEIKVAAQNSAGTGNFSYPIFFKTEDSAPGQVSNLIAFTYNHTMVNVKWFLPKRPNGRITKFVVNTKLARSGQQVKSIEISADEVLKDGVPECFNNSELYSRTTFSPTSSQPVSAIPFGFAWSVPISVVVDQLKPYTSYVFEVFPYTKDYEGQVSTALVRMPESVPEDAPQNLAKGNITSKSFSVFWDSPTIVTGKFSYKVELYGPSGPVSDLKVKLVGSTSVTLSWKTPLQQNGIITQYKILVLKMNQGTVFQNIVISRKEKEANGSMLLSDGMLTEPFEGSADTSRLPANTVTLPASPAVRLAAFTNKLSTSSEDNSKSTLSDISQVLLTSPLPQSSFLVTNSKKVSTNNMLSLPYTGNDAAHLLQGNGADSGYSYTLPVPQRVKRSVVSVVTTDGTVYRSPTQPPLSSRAASAFPNVIEETTTFQTADLSIEEMSYIVTNLLPYTDYTFNVSASTAVGEGPQASIAVKTKEQGLKKYGLYKLRVAASTAAGESSLSEQDDVFVRTLEDAPGSPPFNLTYEAISSTKVEVSWISPLHANGIILSYTIQYWNASHSLNLTSNSTQVILSNLRKYARYQLTVSANTKFGNGNQTSDILNIITMEDVPSSPPRALSIKHMPDSVVKLSWKPPLHPNGEIQYYTIHVWSGTTEIVQNVSNMSVLLDDLESNSEYHAYVTSSTRLGDGGVKSEVVVFRTSEGAPADPPGNLSYVNISSTSIEVLWMPPSKPNGIIQFYTVYYSNSSGNIYSQNVTDIDFENVNENQTYSTIINDMMKYSYYNLWMTASTALGDGNQTSTILAVHTDEDVPDIVQNLLCSGTSWQSVLVQWDAPAKPNGVITHYVVQFGNEIMEFQPTDRVHTFRDLLANASYTYYVMASTVVGRGKRLSCVAKTLQESDPDEPPENVIVVSSSFNSINISWEPPRVITGPTSYLVDIFSLDTQDYNETFTKKPEEARLLFVSNLTAFTTYGVRITAYTGKDHDARIHGKACPLVIVTTMEDKPKDPPKNISFQKLPEDVTKVYITFSPPSEPNGNIIMYQATVEKDGDFSTQIHNLQIVENKNQSLTAVIEGLKVKNDINISTWKEAFFKKPRPYFTNEGFPNPQCSDGRKNPFSDETYTIGAEESCMLPENEQEICNGPLKPGKQYVIRQKQKEGGTYSPRDAEIIDTKFKLDQLITVADLELKEEKLTRPVNKKSFLQHLEELCANNNFKFQEEFSELPKLLQDLATTDADLPWNRSKNRFTNIKPYNNNRVKLMSEPGVPGSDYINASYVSIRCHQYWPEDNKPVTVFGDIVITKLTENVQPDWTVRDLKVEKHGDYMVVRHFNFTSWPEHGVPESSTAIIHFVKLIRAIRAHENTTIAVHCSAGVGRTGVFIALDHLLQHVSDHDFVDIYGLVAELRRERMCMVQNLAQYMFLHQCALDLLSSKGNSQSVWFVNYSALEKMDSLDAMEGDVELEWEETTM
ncbi:PTPRQ phosphatase, partial [Polypterus senegalus]